MSSKKDPEIVRLKRLLQIELALDKVSVVAMRMKNRTDMLRICKVISQQLERLGVKDIRNVQTAIFYTDRGTYMNYEYYAKHNKTFITDTVYTNHRIAKAFAAKMLKGKGSFMVKHIKGEKVKEWLAYQKTTNVFIDDFLKKAKSLSYYWFSLGPVALGISTYAPLSEDDINLFKRFLNVFELAYTRYLEIEKAETRAREAQIDASLERVRSKTMSMNNSQDVGETVAALFSELIKLGIETFRCGIGIMHEKKEMEIWTAKPGAEGKADLIIGHINMQIHQLLRGAINGWKNKKESFSYELSGNDLVQYFEAVNNHTAYPVKYDIRSLPRKIFHHDFYFAEGTLFAFTLEQLTNEKEKIFKRFATVFGQTYRRYLDLQKAEAQAREAQIEASLERVRARAMSMQKSDELKELIGTVFTELTKLDLVLTRCLIMIYDITTNGSTWWMANSEAPSDPIGLFVKYHEADPYLAYLQAWQERNFKWQYILEGKIKKEWDNFLFVETELSLLPDFVIEGMKAPDQVYLNASFNSFGNLTLASLEPLSDEHFEILLRFAKVFDLTYTRFNDLKQAEAQAREAQIEAALERVRSRSMAMHKSEELKDVIRLVLQQFVHLNINAEHAGFYIDYKAYDDMHIWLADPNIEPFYVVIPYFDTPTWNSFLEAKAKGITLHTDLLDFKTKNKFYRSLFKLFTVPEEAKEFYLQCKGLAVSTVLLDNVGLYIENFSAIPYTNEENKILIRFGKVFQQAYTRFLDLQRAEAQAREAQIEAALERVRARTMAMYKSSELRQTSELLFEQLNQLGAELQGVAFAICDANSVMVQKWTSIGIFSHPYTIEPGEQRMYEAWKNQLGLYEEVYEGERQKKYYEAFMEIPEFKQGLQKFIDAGYPLPTWQKNHAVTFKYGYLLFITTKPFNETQIFVRFGKVFEQTYTRFLDLQKAEAQALQAEQDLIAIKEAKQKAEAALTELQATQKQLIQAEKMASLGELTAGIAHEIQNPLNFVNNFSEVSNELIDEMHEELDKGDIEEVKAIALDIKQNLEKINHHGKRADGIVKGMLQHSRISSGQKELTDINALCDEYLRLAYHGLRAKDKTFNAKFETDFDTSIGKINIVPQDTGRVILNLINNAFYAVNEKRKLATENFEPTVIITTKKITDKICVSVKDNGNGIPEAIKEKIFQPFFTTKPTGEGTGLGLSLSYDIIKSHNGEIKVETQHETGTEFIILLPA